MIRFRFIAAAAIALLSTSPALPVEAVVGSLKILAPWARATPKGATIGGGYLTITNTGTAADRLIGGSSAVSEKFEIHEMSMDNGVMKMRPLSAGLEIKPGQSVTLKPGGLHVMFVGLKKPLEKGQQIKTTLVFEKAGKVDVVFIVGGIGAQAPGDADITHDMPGRGEMKH